MGQDVVTMTSAVVAVVLRRAQDADLSSCRVGGSCQKCGLGKVTRRGRALGVRLGRYRQRYLVDYLNFRELA